MASPAGYRGLARMQARTVLAYRADYLNQLIGLLTQIFVLRVVWSTVYGHHTEVAGAPLSLMLAYVTLANVQSWLFNPWQFSLIPDRVRDGLVATDLARPVGFLGQIIARQIGRTGAMLPFAVLALPFAVLLAGMAPPASTASAVGYLVGLVLAYGITTLVSLLLGLSTFWSTEIGGIFLIYRMVSQFLSGALVPLWFMPGTLRLVSQVLPFQAVTYTPTAIYLGTLTGTGALSGVALEAGWVVVLWLATRLVWSRAVHRVVVQGG
ncbi:ABC-2 type transport system permease protein [Streptacidiphilus sp. BW17]|uniref:ABC transporter permease n=1 Tax=Streptacidiphilus sp. BW17 TaxID=3156274 RepID=UPI0035147207